MRVVAPRESLRRAPLRLLVPALVLVALVLPAVGRTAAAPSGIDVSNWQREIDWLAAAGSGRTFVFAKATEGTTFADVTFAVNRAGAAGVGMHVGAYHLARPAGATDATVVASAMEQADRFVTVVQPKPGELLPVLDLEATGGLSVARLTLWVQTWLSEVRERTGSRPIIYASPAFWKEKMGDSPVFGLAGNPLWIAHLQWCWQAGIGQYDIGKIDIRGEKIADVKRSYRLHSDIERELRWIGPLEDVEKPLG